MEARQEHEVGYKDYRKKQRQTEKEKWEDLFQQQLLALNVHAWKRQFKFDVSRRWLCDFAWPDHWILVEIEGGIWRRGGGAHSHPLNVLRDIEKQTRAAELGFRVFRFVGHDLKNLQAVNMMARLVGTDHDWHKR